jgi:hypothetical protein
MKPLPPQNKQSHCTPKRDTSHGILHSIGIYAAWQQKQKQQISIIRQNDKTLLILIDS